MLREFYLAYENDEINNNGIEPIQQNFIKRLRKLKYITYRKIDVLIVYGSSLEDGAVRWDNGKVAMITCYIDKNILNNLDDRNNIGSTYSIITQLLKALWKKNSWNIKDLDDIWEDIQRDDYRCYGNYGKLVKSPNRKLQADFFCDLYPYYTDYYWVLSEKKVERQKVKFLRGCASLSLFFGFFANRYWRDNENFILTDFNKEIFYVFNIHSDQFSLEIFPKLNTLEQCKRYVEAFQAGVANEQRKKLLLGSS